MDRRKFFKISSAAAIASALPLTAKASAGGRDTRSERCRVTVLRRECYTDLQSQYLDEPDLGPCPLFAVGQQFDVDANEAERLIAEGKFCAKAWQCICSKLKSTGIGNCDAKPNSEATNTAITCCNDGTRPVVFKVERL